MTALISLFVTLTAFAFVFAIVVIIHELGHFWVARWCGVRVEAFSVGFGKPLLTRTDRHGTEWRLSAVPLGGFVKFWGDVNAASAPDRAELARMQREMASEHGQEAVRNCYHFKPVWQRMAIVAAGPAANFLLAIILFAGVFLALGEPQVKAMVNEVMPGSAAADAGLEPGDLVVEADGRTIRHFGDLQQVVMMRRGDTVDMVVDRNGDQLTLPVTLKTRFIEDDFGNQVPIGGLGVSALVTEETLTRVRYNPATALWRGTEQTWSVMDATVRYVGRVITGRDNADQLGGILRIGAISGKRAEAAYQEAGEGAPLWMRLANVFLQLVQLVALLSVSIGLINLLPVPMLDGGHLAFYAYEAVARQPLAAQAQEWGLRIGMALVLSLMIFATLNDLRYLRIFDALGNWFS